MKSPFGYKTLKRITPAIFITYAKDIIIYMGNYISPMAAYDNDLYNNIIRKHPYNHITGITSFTFKR